MCSSDLGTGKVATRCLTSGGSMREPSNSASRLCRCRRECHEAIATYLGQDLGSPSSAACHHPPAAHGAGISLLCAWIPCLPSRQLPPTFISPPSCLAIP